MSCWLKDRINNFVDNLVWYIFGAIVFIIASVGAFFWKWAITKQAIVFYGWFWLLLCLAVLFLVTRFIFVILKELRSIKDPADIRNALKKWWRHTQEHSPNQVEFTLYFLSIDKKEHLKKGSAKKYLREIITKDGVWRVIREGQDTLLVETDPPNIPTRTS